MPVEEMENIRNSSVVTEHRKIKIGEKGQGERAAPKRWKAPKVTMPLKSQAGSPFDEDKSLMAAIRKAQGVADNKDILGVPVRLMTDNIDEALFTYRALYNASGRALCKSVLGDPKAKRWFSKKDPGADKGKAVGKGGLFILNQPIDIDCNKTCEYWGKNGEKSQCTWHAIVNVQLEHSPVFPQPTRYRTQGWTVIQHMRGTLNKLAAITGGVLANIPLLLAEFEIDTVTAKGDKRRHPVMEFTVKDGMLHTIREAAVAELMSRRRLEALLTGKHVDTVELTPGKFTAGAMTSPTVDEDLDDNKPPTDIGDPDDLVDFDDAVEAPAATVTPATSAADKENDDVKFPDPLQVEVEAMAAKAEISERGLDGLVEKHQGDLQAVLAELNVIAGAPAQKATVSAAAQETQEIVDDAWGEVSEEKTEIVEEVPEQAKPVQAVSKPVAKPAAAADDFPMFDDD